MTYRRDKELVATHIPLLVRAFDLSQGPVLEIGTGYFSTLLLHWLAHIEKRPVWSYESRNYWYGRARRYASEYHHIELCVDWDQADFVKRSWGLVFVDHSPNLRRPTEIKRLAHLTEYMVIHDTDPERDSMYGYSAIWHLFKWRHDYTKIRPWTTAVSNFYDVSNLA